MEKQVMPRAIPFGECRVVALRRCARRQPLRLRTDPHQGGGVPGSHWPERVWRHWVVAMLDLAAEIPRVPPAMYAQAPMFGAVAARAHGDHAKGQALLEDSDAVWRTLAIGWDWPKRSAIWGVSLLQVGELVEACRVLNEGAALAGTDGNPFTVSMTLVNLGLVFMVQDQRDHAAAPFCDGLTAARMIERASDRTWCIIRAEVHVAWAESERGAHDEAMLLFQDALVGMRTCGLSGAILAYCLDWLAAEFGRTGDPIRAAQLFGAAEAQWRRAGVPRFRNHAVAYARGARAVEAQLDEDTCARAWQAGRAMTVSDVFACVVDENWLGGPIC